MSGNKTLKMSNKALQYMYGVNRDIGASDIHTTRKINKVFEAITKTVIEFEKAEGAILQKGQPIAQEKRGIEEKIDKIRRDDMSAKAIKEDIKTLEKSLEDYSSKIREVENEIENLYKKEVEVTVDRETLSFFFSQLEPTVINRKNKDGSTGPKGFKENNLFQEVFDACEKAS